jgi:hypothetical protein
LYVTVSVLAGLSKKEIENGIMSDDEDTLEKNEEFTTSAPVDWPIVVRFLTSLKNTYWRLSLADITPFTVTRTLLLADAGVIKTDTPVTSANSAPMPTAYAPVAKESVLVVD